MEASNQLDECGSVDTQFVGVGENPGSESPDGAFKSDQSLMSCGPFHPQKGASQERKPSKNH